MTKIVDGYEKSGLFDVEKKLHCPEDARNSAEQGELVVLATPRTFWLKKRYWFFLIVFTVTFGIFWCYLRPVDVTPSTALSLDVGAAYDGVNSFVFRQYFDNLQNEELAPPEDNGYRLLLLALGPRALSANDLADAVDWVDFPTNEKTKDWYSREWVPLCSKFKIDPATRPYFYNQSQLCEKVGNETFLSITKRAWTAEEFPTAARWLTANESYYSLLEQAVEKPVLGVWLFVDSTPEAWFEKTAPDLATYKELALLFAARANYRIGVGDFDGAIADRRRIFRLAHFLLDRREPCLIDELIGLQIVAVGFENVDLSANAAHKPSALLLEQDAILKKEAFGSFDFDSSFQRALHGERNGYLASGIDFITTLKGRVRLAELVFLDCDFDQNVSDAAPLTRFLTRLAQFSAIGLDKNIFLRRLDEYWQSPDLLDEFPEDNLTVLAGAYSPCRRTRSEYFAGFFAIYFLPEFGYARQQLERTKKIVQKEIPYNGSFNTEPNDAK